MTKDTIILGTIAGFIGNIFKEVLSWIFYFLGYLRYTFVHIAAGTLISKEFLDNPISLAVGFIADFILAGTVGVFTLLLIRRTGNDYPIYKSIIFSLLLYVIVFGALMSLNITKISLQTPLPNFLQLFPHLFFGLGMGLIIKKYNKTRV